MNVRTLQCPETKTMKTMPRCITITTILLTLCSSTLHAQEPLSLTAQQWLAKYESDSQAEQTEALAQVAAWLFQVDGESHCKPTKATVDQAAAITEKYLKENPVAWNEDSNTMILVSLRLAWPCAKDKSKAEAKK